MSPERRKQARRPASTSVPIHELLAERWSTRAFSEDPVEQDEIRALLEAMRWAPSCFNEQPWRVLVFDGSDPGAREKAESCLVDGNSWAKAAPLLLMTLHTTKFERNDKPNAHGAHDLGLADMSLTVQAQAMGLAVHMMAGFDREAARELFEVPEGIEPLVMIAIGRPGDPQQLSEELRERQSGPRKRRELTEFAWRDRVGGEPF